MGDSHTFVSFSIELEMQDLGDFTLASNMAAAPGQNYNFLFGLQLLMIRILKSRYNTTTNICDFNGYKGNNVGRKFPVL